MWQCASAERFTDDALGGNAYAVVRLEAEFPLPVPEEYGISGGAFIDYGSVWDVGAPEQFDVSFGATGPWTDVFAFALELCACWGKWGAEGAAESVLLSETSL